MNRIGDFGFALAMFLIFKQFRLAGFREGVRRRRAGAPETRLLTTIGLLLLVGAAGKSAQIPLYVWLPDAMAGPTPVSALIHAATMVTAGVYMIGALGGDLFARARARWTWSRSIGIVDRVHGGDHRPGAERYQEGLRVLDRFAARLHVSSASASGAFSAGIYHLVTHAFFKALLFLGAGSVIHALLGEQDMRHMGGLRKNIPVDFRDHDVRGGGDRRRAAVLRASSARTRSCCAAHHHAPWMYWVGVVTAGMTAFYVFRAMFLTFFGEYRGHASSRTNRPR